MKILISSSLYTPHISGLTIAVKNLAELLSRDNYHVTVLTTQHEKKLPLSEDINGVVVRRVPYVFKISKGYIMPEFFMSTYRAFRNTDQVLINLPQFEGFVIAALAKIMGKKVHAFYHCNVIIQGGFMNRIPEMALRLANVICLSLADSIIATSEDFASHDPLLKPYTKRVTAIYPVMSFPKKNEIALQHLTKRVPKRRYVIGFLGRIAADKGIEYLFESIPLLKKQLGNDFIIVLAGPTQAVGEKAYVAKVTSLLKKYQDTVCMLGELEDSELGAFYSLLDVLVLPSVNSTEAFGMVQVESMSLGTPVVASDLPGVRVPVTVTGMGEIARVADVEDLAKKIRKVLLHPKQYNKERIIIEKEFSPVKILDAYKKIFY